MDENALIESARKGDLDSFNSLVLIYQQLVYNLAYRIMGDEPHAADATQEAFISVYKNLDSFHGGSFKSWLRRIVTNACYDELRRKKRRPSISLDELADDQDHKFEVPSADEGPEALVQRHELADLIQIGIATLPYDQRITLVLRDVQGLRYEEVATITNTNPGTVKSRLSRGRAKLRDYLQIYENSQKVFCVNPEFAVD